MHRAEQCFSVSREWAVVDADGEALTQKRLPKLATIKPVLDLEEGDLHILSLLPSLQQDDVAYQAALSCHVNATHPLHSVSMSGIML